MIHLILFHDRLRALLAPVAELVPVVSDVASDEYDSGNDDAADGPGLVGLLAGLVRTILVSKR